MMSTIISLGSLLLRVLLHVLLLIQVSPSLALSSIVNNNNNKNNNVFTVRQQQVQKVPLRRNDPDSPYALSLITPTRTTSTVSTTSTTTSSLDLPTNYNFLATQVWPSSRSAATAVQGYLLSQEEERTTSNNSNRRPSKVIRSICEFGCGPGLPSLTAAKVGKRIIDKVYATDVDEFALELVREAAKQQDLICYDEKEKEEEVIITTMQFDLIEGKLDDIPEADLYLFSDVFESNAVARGAAKVVSYLLLLSSSLSSKIQPQPKKKNVWVFAQSDRVQRETFLNEMKIYTNNPSLTWKPYSPDGPGEDDMVEEGRLWLCDIEETSVIYG